MNTGIMKKNHIMTSLHRSHYYRRTAVPRGVMLGNLSAKVYQNQLNLFTADPVKTLRFAILV